MFGRLLSVALISAVIGVAHGYAQPIEPTQQAILTNVKQSIARTIGAENRTVEIHVTNRIFTVRLVNTKFNEGTPAQAPIHLCDEIIIDAGVRAASSCSRAAPCKKFLSIRRWSGPFFGQGYGRSVAFYSFPMGVG
jgi:hypothetical protein